MIARLITSLGLAFGIAGTILIFIWGPPQPNLEVPPTEVMSFLAAEGTVDNSAARDSVLARREVHNKRSRLGLGLIALGFLCQLASVWVPAASPARPPVPAPALAPPSARIRTPPLWQLVLLVVALGFVKAAGRRR